MKDDNERLLKLLKNTTEYADMEDSQILKSAVTHTMKGVKGLEDSLDANKRSRGFSADATG